MRVFSLLPSCSRPHLGLLICFATAPVQRAKWLLLTPGRSPFTTAQLPVQLLNLTIYHRPFYYVILGLTRETGHCLHFTRFTYWALPLSNFIRQEWLFETSEISVKSHFVQSFLTCVVIERVTSGICFSGLEHWNTPCTFFYHIP